MAEKCGAGKGGWKKVGGSPGDVAASSGTLSTDTKSPARRATAVY